MFEMTAFPAALDAGFWTSGITGLHFNQIAMHPGGGAIRSIAVWDEDWLATRLASHSTI